jgi:ABC-type glycerol-3-phosphate transport system substrate-binding protein
MQRLLPALVASALLLAPHGARAADLLVWWEKGFYPQEDAAVAEIIAAFEQKTGKQVELVQYAQDEIIKKAASIPWRGRRPISVQQPDQFCCRAMGLR